MFRKPTQRVEISYLGKLFLSTFLTVFLISSITGYSQNCDHELAYWSLDDCMTDTIYDEFTVVTSTVQGLDGVSGTNFVSEGHHSCTPGISGVGMCHGIDDDCTWKDNNPSGFKFSVTVEPNSDYYGFLSGISFYESAPLNYLWTTGQTGDNDPPQKYGIRVLKNGTEVFRQIEIATSDGYSLEEFDFSGDPDFMFDSKTTFEFELTGYCRQARTTTGFAVWDVDEIKITGCTEPKDPCRNLGGDTDMDGVCDDNDCRPNDPNISNPGDRCNDNNSLTTNDVIQSDCSCQGTPGPGPGSGCNTTWSVNGRTITVNNVVGTHTQVQIFNSAGNMIFTCNNFGTGAAVCGNDQSFTVPADGIYFLQIQTYADWANKLCDIWEEIPIGNVGPPAGTCSINASVSNVVCSSNGTADPNDDTYSFDVTAHIINGGGWGFDVFGTNVMMWPSGGTATVSGLRLTGGTQTFTVGDHDVQNCTTTITVQQPGAPCAAPSTNNTGCNVEVSSFQSSILVKNLTGTYNEVKIFDQDWNLISQCDSWSGGCVDQVSIPVLGNSYYYVLAKTFDGSWQTICDVNERIAVVGEGRLTLNFGQDQGIIDLNIANETGLRIHEFEVQKSRTLDNFETILTRISTSDEIDFADFVDKNPAPGITYYRAKLTLFEGTIIYSDPIMVEVEMPESFEVFPNPAAENVNISLVGFGGKDVQITFYNHLGQVEKYLEMNEVSDIIPSVDISDLSRGIYILRISSPGIRPVSKRLMVSEL